MHDDGISFSMGWLWDGGIDVTIGEDEKHVRTMDGIAALMQAYVLQHGEGVPEKLTRGTFQTELQKMYDSEFHVDISCRRKGKISVDFDLGEVKGVVETVAEVVPCLQEGHAEHWADSQYHVERMGGTWKPKWYGPIDYAADTKLMAGIEGRKNGPTA